jgi:hypothetical protein
MNNLNLNVSRTKDEYKVECAICGKLLIHMKGNMMNGICGDNIKVSCLHCEKNNTKQNVCIGV